MFTGFGWPIRNDFWIPEVTEIHSFVRDTATACQTLYPSKKPKEGEFSVKRTVAKFVLLTSLVLSAFSIAGAVVNQGKDLPGPFPTCPPGTNCDLGK